MSIAVLAVKVGLSMLVGTIPFALAHQDTIGFGPRPRAAPPAATPFCEEFFSVYDQRTRGFEDLRGAFDQSREEWVSVRDLPSATRCSIRQLHRSVSYQCLWRVDQSLNDATNVAFQLTNEMRQCLGARGVAFGPAQPRLAGQAYRDDWPVNQRGENIVITTDATQSRGPPVVTVVIEVRQ